MKNSLIDDLPIFGLVAALALITAPYSMANQPTTPPGTGCVWSESHGSCMIANLTAKPITCDIRVQVTTEKYQKTTKIQTVIKSQETYHTVTFKPEWEDKIERAQIAAKCK